MKIAFIKKKLRSLRNSYEGRRLMNTRCGEVVEGEGHLAKENENAKGVESCVEGGSVHQNLCLYPLCYLTPRLSR